MNKKIAILSSGFMLGGFTASLRSTLHELKENGIEVDIYQYRTDDTSAYMDRSLYHELYHIAHRKNSVGYRSSLMNPKFLKERFVSKDPIALKQMELISYTKNCLEPLDLTAYDAVVSWEEMQCNYYLAQNVKAKKKIGYVHPDYVMAGFHKEIDGPLFEKLDALVAVSNATKQTLIQTFPAMENKIYCVYNPLDKERVKRMANEAVIPKDGFTLCTVARIENKSKAVDRIVRMCERLEEERIAYTWNIVGDGPDFAAMKSQAQSLKHLHFLGRKDNPYPYIVSSDLFVLQSNYEGLSVTVEEAKTLGVPVLITDYPSSSEQIKDGCDGFIVKNNEEDIYRKLKQCILNPAKTQNMREFLPLHSDFASKRLYDLV